MAIEQLRCIALHLQDACVTYIGDLGIDIAVCQWPACMLLIGWLQHFVKLEHMYSGLQY